MTFKKKDNADFYNPIRRAVMNYQMIQPGDKVAVGMSGGKDSTSLLTFLDLIRRQKRLGYDFELQPVALDMGMDIDLAPLENYTAALGYTLNIVPTRIAPIVFEVRREKSPCSLCAKLRRGILYRRAVELGCGKVALGHHLDDAIETYFMNLLLHGRMTSFEPFSHLTKTGIDLIRPMIYVEEREIIRFAQREELPVLFNPCPADKKTERERTKRLVTRLSAEYPDIRQKFILGMEQGTTRDFWQADPRR